MKCHVIWSGSSGALSVISCMATTDIRKDLINLYVMLCLEQINTTKFLYIPTKLCRPSPGRSSRQSAVALLHRLP